MKMPSSTRNLQSRSGTCAATDVDVGGDDFGCCDWREGIAMSEKMNGGRWKTGCRETERRRIRVQNGFEFELSSRMKRRFLVAAASRGVEQDMETSSSSQLPEDDGLYRFLKIERP
ncbi:hypothetical protein ACFX2A_028360 [Malus domestica]